MAPARVTRRLAAATRARVRRATPPTVPDGQRSTKACAIIEARCSIEKEALEQS
jgi:hypothetical protein